MKTKKKKLGLDALRPWDIEAEPAGIQPLRPFKTGEELTEKTIDCFNAIESIFWRLSAKNEGNGSS